MNNNKQNNSNIELILDKVNGEYVLVNKKDVESAIELKNKLNEELLSRVESQLEGKNDENSMAEFESKELKIEEQEDNVSKFARVLEISRDSLMGNTWINPVEFLAIIDENSNDKLSSYISKIEEKTNKLYEDLVEIVVKKYRITEENKVDEISDMYDAHDSDLDKYLDLVDDVIYNIEVDWNDFLLIDNKLNLFDSYTVEKKINDEHGKMFQEVVDNSEVTEETQLSNVSTSEEVHPVSISLDAFESTSKFNLQEIIDSNQESDVNTKNIHEELESKNNDELNEYINTIVSQINFVQTNIDEKLSLYRTLATEKFANDSEESIISTLDRLSVNSHTAEEIMNKIMNSNDSDEIKNLLLERNDINESNVKSMKIISKHVDLDETLSSLNDEIISLKIALDNLTIKLSVAYNIAHKNYSIYSKSVDKENSKLLKEAQKKFAKEQKLRLKLLRQQQKLINQESSNLEDEKIMEEIISHYQNKNDVVYNLHNDSDAFADIYQMKTFRNKLSNRINYLLKLGKDSDTVSDEENIFNNYFIFMNSELGIISELSELAGLLELKRTKLLTEICENEILNYKTSNINDKILFTVRANFSFLKILSAEVLVLKTILLHREYLALVKEKAKQQCNELASYIEWEHRLYWWSISTTDAINSAFNNDLYSHDNGIQYLYDKLNSESDYEDECCDEIDDCCCSSSDTLPMPKVMVMKFERVIEKEKIVEKNVVKNIIKKQPEVKKVDELVDETKKNKKLRKLNNQGMSKAGLRIEEIINETKSEVKEYNKEKN